MAMAKRRTLGLSTAVLAVLLLAGCSDAEGGDPTGPGSGPTGASTPPSSDGGNSGAPSVSDPIDVSGLEQDPCTALSSAQVNKLNLLQGKPHTAESTGQPACEYEYNDGSGSRVLVTLNPDFTNGLGDIYARKPELKQFEPTEVSGYPAVYADPYGQTGNGTCQLHTGLTDQFVVTTFVQLTSSTSDFPKGCEVAELTTQTMIENLKGGS